jgi:hypothetical protein
MYTKNGFPIAAMIDESSDGCLPFETLRSAPLLRANGYFFL